MTTPCPICGEPPFTGHWLGCSALRGQREYRDPAAHEFKADPISEASCSSCGMPESAHSSDDMSRSDS